MIKWKKILNLLVVVLTSATGITQSNNNIFYRHSVQFNIAGLGFERWGMAYELARMYKYASGLDFGISLGYSFGGGKN